MAVNFELRQPEVVKRMLQLKIQQYPISKIAETISKEFGIKANYATINNVIKNEIAKYNMSFDNKDLLVDKDQTTKMIVEKMKNEIMILHDSLREINKRLNAYKDKVFKWIEVLENDTLNYYQRLDKNKIDIRDIDAIKGSLEKSVAILESFNNTMLKNMEFYSRLLFRDQQPAEIKEQKVLQINMNAIKIVSDMEKRYGFMFIKPKTEAFQKLIEEKEKEGEVEILRETF